MSTIVRCEGILIKFPLDGETLRREEKVNVIYRRSLLSTILHDPLREILGAIKSSTNGSKQKIPWIHHFFGFDRANLSPCCFTLLTF